MYQYLDNSIPWSLGEKLKTFFKYVNLFIMVISLWDSFFFFVYILMHTVIYLLMQVRLSRQPYRIYPLIYFVWFTKINHKDDREGRGKNTQQVQKLYLEKDVVLMSWYMSLERGNKAFSSYTYSSSYWSKYQQVTERFVWKMSDKKKISVLLRCCYVGKRQPDTGVRSEVTSVLWVNSRGWSAPW